MGRTLGRYELQRRIGRGGMADVWLAERRGLRGVVKQVVIKRVRPERARDPRFVELFVREARLSMSLAHKNVVQVFDFGRAGDELFLVMEHVDGGDLAALLAGGALDPTVAAFVALEASQALDYAHARGEPVVHRDVTPRNVLVSRAGEVKLTDFGVAAELAAAVADGMRGTPWYMAPEQARGEAIDPRADIYALGLVLWEALTGERAFAAGSPGAALALARAGEVPPLPDAVPAELRAIVERATARDPAERFATARELHRALDELLVGLRAATRAQPPALALAALVAERCPAGEPAGDESDDAVVAGEAVTFMDDADGDPDRFATMAATIAEARTQEAPPEVSPPSRRGALIAAAVVGVAAVALAAVGLIGDGTPAVVSVADAAPPPPPDAALPDAMPPPPDAAPPPPDAAPARPPPRRIDAAPPRATYQIEIHANPWAAITVEGSSASCAETPCKLRLPAGRWTVRADNPVLRRRGNQVIEVVPGDNRPVRITLAEPY